MARKPRMTKRDKGRAILQATAGTEPVATGPVDTWWLVRAYNWYSVNTDSTTAIGWLNDAVGIPVFSKKENDPTIVHLGYIARLLKRKVQLPAKTLAFFKRELQNVMPKSSSTVTVKTVTIDKDQAIIDFILGLVEQKVDEQSKSGTEFSLAATLKEHDPKGLSKKSVVATFEPVMREVAMAALNKDPELVEAYRNYTTAQLKKKARFLAQIVADARDHEEVAIVKVRKPRKVRPVNVAKNFANLKYQKEHSGLKSIDPLQIHGAKALWVFNTKYNKLGVFVANSSEALSIKGTSVINFDEIKSISRTIRKPETLNTKLQPMDYVGKNIAAFFKEQKTTISQLRSRIGEDTILLKVIR